MNAHDIQLLHSAGLITVKQRDAIIARYVNKPKSEIQPANRETVYVLASLAAILIVSGSILLARDHWHEITPLMKIAAGMLIMAIAWSGCLWLRDKKPILSEGLGLLGAGMWGANIILVNTLFELDNPAVESFFLFFAAALPIPFLIRQRILLGIVMLSSLVLLYMVATAPENSWLSVEWVQAFSGTQWSLALAILFIWWLVGERYRGCTGEGARYYWIAFPAYFAFLSLAQYFLLYSDSTPILTAEYNWLIFAAATLFIPLLKPRDTRWLHWIAASTATLALAPLAICLSQLYAYQDTLGMLVGAAFAGLFMTLGVRSGRLAWVYISIMMMIFLFADLMYHLEGSMDDSGLFLIATGVSVLAFAYALEKQRRFLVRKIKEKSPTDTLPPIPKA